MANIIDTGIEIAGPPDLIRATLDRILERSVVTNQDVGERAYISADELTAADETKTKHDGPVTWFCAAELRQPKLLNEWSDERHRVAIFTESKWQAPWKLIHELIQAGLDVRAVWKDDDGCLDSETCLNWGGFGEIRSYRNGELFETTENMFDSYDDRLSYISILEGDNSDPKLGFIEYCANGDEWLDFGMIGRKETLDQFVEEPGAEELDILEMGGTDAIIKAINVQELVLGSPLFPLARKSNSLVQIKSTGITITNSGKIEPRTEVN